MADLRLDDYHGTDEEEDPDITAGGEEPPRAQMRAVVVKTSKWVRAQKKREWLANHALYLANNRSASITASTGPSTSRGR